MRVTLALTVDLKFVTAGDFWVYELKEVSLVCAY